MRERDEIRRRAARNEALFRETNEAIERGQWPGEPEKALRFRCECANLECGDAVEVTLREYETVRADPRRFVVAVGHDIPEVEDVVASTGRFMVVQKKGAGGELAEATDPRG